MNVQMRNVYYVARREITEVVYRRAFYLSLFIPLSIIVLILCLGPLFETVDKYVQQNKTKTGVIGVISPDPSLVQAWQQELQNYKLQSGMPQFTLQPLAAIGISPEILEKNAQAKVRSKELDAYVLFQGDITQNGECRFYALRDLQFNFTQNLYPSLEKAVRQARLKDKGLDPELVQFLSRGITWNEFLVSDEVSGTPVNNRQEQPALAASDQKGEEKPVENATQQGQPERRPGFDQLFLPALACVMLMFFLIYGTGEAFLKGVVHEKSSRMVEILLSSLSPTEILAGKVIGFYVIGLIQFVLWVVMAVLVSSIRGITFPATINPTYFFHFLIFLTTGYLFFAAVFATVGSMIGQDQDPQIYLVWVSLLLSVPLFFCFLFISQPMWWPVRLVSFIPFFSPMIMAMRMSVAAIPLWEIGLVALNLLIFSVLGILLAARIFRVSLLMMGKGLSLRELGRWAFYRERSSIREAGDTI